ncbi:MAG: trehalose-phosphatase [Deltaproteobacteria bacterium]|nr:trehalose-phosphatase [Deltaproteobacteria bacterium]
MRALLTPGGRAALEAFTRTRPLLGFDFDGTLAPIVGRPAAARMRASTRALLAAVAARYPCIVISGRGRADVAARLTGLRLREVIGNHGAEPSRGARALLEVVAGWRPRLEAALHRYVGVTIEDKGYSLAVHYRHAPHPQRVRAAIRAAGARLGEVRMVGGKRVVNLIPAQAPDKGMALERARVRLGCQTALYVGDDDTDEDVFGLGHPERLLTVRIGSKRASQAEYYLDDQRAIDDLLRLLLDSR